MLYTSVLLASLASAALADSINCQAYVTAENGNAKKICQASYPAGPFGTCSDPYTAETLEVGGLVPGTYCVRECTTMETNDCNAKMCKSYSEACGVTKPKSCQLAIQACKGEVTNEICNMAGLGYGHCSFTDKCQEQSIPCCPEGIEDKAFKVAVFNSVKKNVGGKANGKLVRRVSADCSPNSEADFNAIVKQYTAQGGKALPTSLAGQSGNDCRNLQQETFLNTTSTLETDQDAVVVSLRNTCQQNKGKFAYKIL